MTLPLSASQQSFFSYKAKIDESFTNEQNSHSIKTIQQNHNKAWPQGYAFSSKIKNDVAFEFQLYMGLLNDKTWFLLSDSVKTKIRYNYVNHAIFLLENARGANDKAKIRRYEQSIFRASHDLNLWHLLDTSILIDGLNVLNSYRRITQFCRLTWKNIWLLGSILGWLDEKNHFLNHPINIAILDMPVDIYNALAVAIYAIRLTINLSLLIRHIVFPTTAEKEIDWLARFLLEWEMRGLSILNEAIKTVMNTLINYAAVFQITPFVSTLILSLLVFDFLRFTYLYLLEIQHLKRGKNLLYQMAELTEEARQIKYLLLSQHELLETEKKSILLFSLAASLTLLMSFAIGLYIPVAWSSLFLITTVLGSVMYSTAIQFGQFIRARHEQIDDADHHKLTNRKWDEFLLSVGKNFCVPMFITGLLTIHWPSAVLLTFLYMAYECHQRIASSTLNAFPNSQMEEDLLFSQRI